jgi:hypothetical protein
MKPDVEVRKTFEMKGIGEFQAGLEVGIVLLSRFIKEVIRFEESSLFLDLKLL